MFTILIFSCEFFSQSMLLTIQHLIISHCAKERKALKHFYTRINRVFKRFSFLLVDVCIHRHCIFFFPMCPTDILLWNVKKFLFYLYLWLRWVFVAMCGLSLVATRGGGGSSSLRCWGFLLQWCLLLPSIGCRAHRLLWLLHPMWHPPWLGLNLCPLHW